MTAKEYLSQLGVLNRKISHKKRELEEVRRETGINRNGSDESGKVQTSFTGPTGSQTESQAIRIATLREAISNGIVEYLEQKSLIIDQIHSLDDSLDIDILYRRYVQEERHFEKIALEMGYAYQYIINKHGDALKRFEERFPEILEKDVIKSEDILK